MAYQFPVVGAFWPLVCGLYWKRSTTQGAIWSIVLGMSCLGDTGGHAARRSVPIGARRIPAGRRRHGGRFIGCRPRAMSSHRARTASHGPHSHAGHGHRSTHAEGHRAAH